MKTPEEKKAYQKTYHNLPEKKARAKALIATPERKVERNTYMRKYYAKPEVKAKVKVYQTTPEYKIRKKVYCRKRDLKNQYDLTPEQYQEMLLKQNNSCAICGRNQNEFKKELCVDHDHKTGKVRGLVCINCNVHIIGFDNMKDYFTKQNISILKTIIEYLNRE